LTYVPWARERKKKVGEKKRRHEKGKGRITKMRRLHVHRLGQKDIAVTILSDPGRRQAVLKKKSLRENAKPPREVGLQKESRLTRREERRCWTVPKFLLEKKTKEIPSLGELSSNVAPRVLEYES